MTEMLQDLNSSIIANTFLKFQIIVSPFLHFSLALQLNALYFSQFYQFSHFSKTFQKQNEKMYYFYVLVSTTFGY